MPHRARGRGALVHGRIGPWAGPSTRQSRRRGGRPIPTPTLPASAHAEHRARNPSQGPCVPRRTLARRASACRGALRPPAAGHATRPRGDAADRDDPRSLSERRAPSCGRRRAYWSLAGRRRRDRCDRYSGIARDSGRHFAPEQFAREVALGLDAQIRYDRQSPEGRLHGRFGETVEDL